MDSYLAYENPSTTDAKLDTEQLTVGANTVQRERIQIAGSTALQIAPVDATAGLKVNLGADNDVTVTGNLTTVTTVTAVDAVTAITNALPAGTNAIGKLAANSGVDIGDVDVTSITGVTMSNAAMQITGDEAADAVDAGNPVKVGMKAIAFGANPTEVAAADRTDWYANRAGIPFVLGGHMNTISVAAAYTGAETDTAIITAAGGTKIVVTQIQLVASNANTVNVAFYIGFHATTTPTTTGVVLTHPGVAPGSGVSRGDGTGVLGVGGDGDDLRITSGAPTTGSIRVLVSYFTIPS